MDNNIGEIICNAVDTIVTKKLEGLQYDITKICNIVNDNDRNQGKYIVSDGTIKFDAYSNITSYRKGNSVLVNIPNGDFNMQKTIIGKQTSVNTEPFNYVSPLDTMIRITNNQVQDCNSGGLLANDNNEMTYVQLLDDKISIVGGLAYSRLGITADFKTWLDGMNVKSGIYGLKIYIYSKPNDKETYDVFELNFTNKDMYGNPYAYESYFSQEKVFDISNIENVESIQVYFYQQGDFVNGEDASIPYQYTEGEFIGSKLPNNLFVDNVKVFLGYDKQDFKDETLILNTSSSLGYQYSNENNDKTVNLRWVHKITDNDYVLLEQEDLDNNEYGYFEIHWFKYNEGIENINQYAGIGWEEINTDSSNPFELIFTPDSSRQTEQIKVIGLFKPSDEGSIEQNTIGQVFTSNIITFENMEKVPDSATLEAATALSILCDDGTDGNYFIYNQNGKLINEGEGKGKIRKMRALFKGAEITNEYGKVESMTWWVPYSSDFQGSEHSTMIAPLGKGKEDLMSYRGVWYKLYEFYPDEQGSFTDLEYYIEDFWTQFKANNTVRCVLKMNGIDYEAIKEFRFGKAGSNGSNLSLVLSYESNNAIEIDKERNIFIRAYLYDINGKQLQIDVENLSWDLSFSSLTLVTMNENKELIKEVKLLDNIQSIPEFNCTIIGCHLKTLEYQLDAYLPIPIKYSQYSFIEGAREIIYNNQGQPRYYTDAYKIYNDLQEEVYEDIEWDMPKTELIGDNTAADSYLPKLKDITIGNKKYKCLVAPPFQLVDTVNVYCKNIKNNQVIWSQPILVMQSQYDFAMLNSWGGNLTLNENNGTILSTMLGAGKKNDDNTFSGVMVGDIQTGSGLEDTEKLTGVYGIDRGVISYALKEDGSATFGHAGNGQIQINGYNATIKSAGYLAGGAGMLIDMKAGKIDIKGKSGGQVLIQPQDTYFQINSTTDETLLNISNGNYYLQSNNYTEGGVYGTKIDLMDGEMNIKSPYGKTTFSNGDSEPFLKISVPNDNQAITSADYGIDLIHIASEDYFLQSKGYTTQTIKKINSYNSYTDTNGNVVAISPEGKIYEVVNGQVSQAKIFNQQEIKVVKEYDNDGKPVYATTIVTPAQVEDSYKAGLTPIYEDTLKKPSGFKFDLKNGNITGYDISLKGINKSDPNKSFILDSSNNTIPLKIGDKFSIAWDGTLTANKVNSLNNDGRNQYAISIGNNFYVAKDGSSAGGSNCTWNGPATSLAGWTQRQITLANGQTGYVLSRG